MRSNHPVAPDPASAEPAWKKVLRAVFLIGFFGLMIDFMLLFGATVSAHNGGAPTRTPTQTVPFTQHGNTKFITEAEALRINQLFLALEIGVPTVALLGLIFRFGLKVDVFR